MNEWMNEWIVLVSCSLEVRQPRLNIEGPALASRGTDIEGGQPRGSVEGPYSSTADDNSMESNRWVCQIDR